MHQTWYEELFISHLRVGNGQPTAKALIVHVSDSSAGIANSAASAQAACAAGATAIFNLNLHPAL